MTVQWRPVSTVDGQQAPNLSTNDYLKDAPLGQSSGHVCKYDPDQLFPVPRSNSWQERGYVNAPFQGCDIWNAYELSWLNLKGLPQVAMAEFVVSCELPCIIKSNCPVTGQPDWASVQIEYRGAPIDKEGLLKYLVSYREHQDFHE